MANTYLPGHSPEYAALERNIELDSINRFHKTNQGNIARLKSKNMGPQNGLCPTEEILSLTMLDPGALEEIGCEDDGLTAETQQGVDSCGNVVDIPTLGSNSSNRLCKDAWSGSFAVGKDSYRPTFHRKQIRYPMFCLDQAQTSTTEAKKVLQTIKMEGSKLATNMLNYNLYDEILKRQNGNTSISQEPIFSRDAGLPLGTFPHKPEGYLDHGFMKRVQEIVMREPSNHGKKFYVEASAHQVDRAIEWDQQRRGIERRSMDKLVDPFRVGETMEMYDGIVYVKKHMADYVGLVELPNGGCRFIRPFEYVHQAGNVYGTVARPNYALDQGDYIRQDGKILEKFEIANWYVEDAISFVPWYTKGDVPSSGEEKLKDQNYGSPVSFKPFWVAPHAIKDCDGNLVDNGRNQYQQMGLELRFGLYHRPDIIESGSVMIRPTTQTIELRPYIPSPDQVSRPDIKQISEDRESVLYADCNNVASGSSPTQAGGQELSEIPGATPPYPPNADTLPGTFVNGGSGVSIMAIEELDDQVCVTYIRADGSQGAAELTLTPTDGTAVAGTNFNGAVGTLSWADGETGPKTFCIPLIDADIAADVEFTVVATNTGGVGAIDAGADIVTVTVKPTP